MISVTKKDNIFLLMFFYFIINHLGVVGSVFDYHATAPCYDGSLSVHTRIENLNRS